MKNNENTKIDRRQLHVLITEGNSCADDGLVKQGRGSFKRHSLCLFVSATCVLSYPFGLSSVVRPSPQGDDGYAENLGLMVCLSPTRYLDLGALPENLGLIVCLSPSRYLDLGALPEPFNGVQKWTKNLVQDYYEFCDKIDKS